MRLVEAERVCCRRTSDAQAPEERSSVPTLVVLRQGVYRYHGERQTTIADANTVLLFHPSHSYRISHPTDHGDECIALRFDPDAIADALGPAGEAARAWILDASSQRMVQQYASGVLTAHDHLSREERASQLLAALSGRALTSRREDPRIGLARERIAGDITVNLSLAAIAREVGWSPFHLARQFRAHTGTSLHQYRLALRLNLARTMLRDGAEDLTRLALDLGFASHAHFSAAFRAAYGMSPSAARSRHRPGSPSGGPVAAND